MALFHPGYVQTDMNNGEGQITAQESVEKTLKALQALTPEQSGFYNYDGESIGW